MTVNDVLQLNRTLEQELFALARGVSLECLVCGEFVLHAPDGSLRCPECESGLSRLAAGAVLPRGADAAADRGA
jgi:Zn finger protein HypA/HybF involved in hydrogenase expression